MGLEPATPVPKRQARNPFRHRGVLDFGVKMDRVTVLNAGVADSSSTEKEQKFLRFSLFHNPSYPHLIESVNCRYSYSCKSPNLH